MKINNLFIRIFASFWLIIIATMIFAAFAGYFYHTRMDEVYSNFEIDETVIRAGEVLDTQGYSGLKIWLKNIDNREHYKIYNIGNNKTESLQDFISTIEQAIGKKAIKEMYPMQQGDVPKTFANIDQLIRDYKYSPVTDIKSGIESFIKWYKNYNLK